MRPFLSVFPIKPVCSALIPACEEGMGAIGAPGNGPQEVPKPRWAPHQRCPALQGTELAPGPSHQQWGSSGGGTSCPPSRGARTDGSLQDTRTCPRAGEAEAELGARRGRTHRTSWVARPHPEQLQCPLSRDRPGAKPF